MIVTALIFIVMLGILIAVHEWGHFIAAKKCGVDVDQFAIGFGPKLYSWVSDGTEFCICAIPLGGYVKLAGFEKEERTGSPHEYYSKPVGHRSWIIFAGPLVNYVFALLCFIAVLFLGKVDLKATSENIESRTTQEIAAFSDDSPAKEAGLQVGDKIIQINDTPIANWIELKDAIMTSDTPAIHVVAKRLDQELTFDIVPNLETIKGKEHRLIGISPHAVELTKDDIVVHDSAGPIEAIKGGVKDLIEMTVLSYSSLWQMVTGQISPKKLAGPVGIYGFVGGAVSYFKFGFAIGMSVLLHLVGIISASLAIFNLLPMIPFDGGHLVMLAIEKIRGSRLPEKVENWIAKVGISLILALTVFVFYADFERIGLFDAITNLWGKLGL